MNVVNTDCGPALADSNLRLNILFIHESLPRPDRCGSDVRVMQVLRELREQGHAVTYLARFGKERERYSPDLESMGIRVYANDAERLRFAGINAPVEWSFQAVLTEGRFDLAILYLWFWTPISVPEHYLDPIREFSPQTRIAILTEDQHASREEGLAQISGLLPDFLRAADLKQREREVYGAADLVLSISNADIQGITAMVPDVRARLLTMTADIVPVRPFEQRAGVLFVGDFSNRTTRDSADWLLKAIWPEVRRKLPEAQLYIAGNLSTSCGLEVSAGVRVLGHVEDLGELYQSCRVFAAPTRSCTGIQTKILQALSHGLPTVTTPVASKGLGLLDGYGALLAEEACEFANKIVRLYDDPALWESISALAQNHVRKELSRERLHAQVRDLAASIPHIEPRPFDRNHTFSILRVEREFPGAVENPHPKTRFVFRTMGHLRLGEELLGLGKPNEAREQLLHIFAFLYGRIPAGEFFARVLTNLFRCEELLGSRKDGYLTAAQDCLNRLNSGTKPRVRKPACPTRQPAISVIIPTFNRSAVLASCLAALVNQSIEKSNYEVIVADDGSEDSTEQLCRKLSPDFQFCYCRQKNSGAGAARNLGLSKARGKYVLFINDDTMASATLLEEHLRAHRSCPGKKFAALGDFAYPPFADRRALTYFLSKRPFLFPQVRMNKGFYQGSAYFITCNLSLARQAVLEAGSFDDRFHVGEDTELGARLASRGYEVLYWPAARATHDHLNLRADDIVRRACSYGPATLLLLRKHPSLLGEGSTPFGRLDAEWKARTAAVLQKTRGQVEDALAAARRLDSFNFSALLKGKIAAGNSSADEIVSLLEKAITHVYWFYLLEAMVNGLDRKESRGTAMQASTSIANEEDRLRCPL